VVRNFAFDVAIPVAMRAGGSPLFAIDLPSPAVDFDVAMWQLCNCPSGFLRICNVTVRGGAATLKKLALAPAAAGFPSHRHIQRLVDSKEKASSSVWRA
jgi:hypothetical protein